MLAVGNFFRIGFIAIGFAALSCAAEARAFSVLYSFSGHHGALPSGGLISDGGGNLYGATLTGGAADGGSIYRLAPGGSETVLFSFDAGDNSANGNGPGGTLLLDSDGNLFGTTNEGGAGADGTVYELTAGGAEIILHAFLGGSDGAQPRAGVIVGDAGNLYGTTLLGGNGKDCDQYGCGTVFRIAPDGTDTVLHAFSVSEGEWLYSGLVEDAARNLYGTASFGGDNDAGTVFRIASDGIETTLYSFKGGSDGRTPVAGLWRDDAGNLYGTTDNGGEYGLGTVFSISAGGAYQVLHSFKGGRNDGAFPDSALVGDGKGNLYGTTRKGGAGRKGTAFMIRADGSERILHNFAGTDGRVPFAPLLFRSGTIYGTTQSGGLHNKGVAFEIAR